MVKDVSKERIFVVIAVVEIRINFVDVFPLSLTQENVDVVSRVALIDPS